MTDHPLSPARPVRIANCSGFYGDRLAAPEELLAGSDPVDVLTGDYLAELTMLILWKARAKDPTAGYARTFATQLESILGTCLDRGVRIVTNAGGLNPEALAERVDAIAGRLGLSPRIGVVQGDDLVDRLDELQASGEPLTHLDTGQPLAASGIRPLTANAYLGGGGIVAALAGGADIVICPRVTDAALVTGPAAWWHGWTAEDLDPLAGAVVAGHVIECGAQATGGNFSFFSELPDHRYPGFPIAEVAADGSSVITKQPGTGGMVTVETVTAQLLYEIDGRAYPNPDVVARFDTIAVAQEGPDRVAIRGARGEPPPEQLKVALTYDGGYRNTMTMILTGLAPREKADLATDMLFELLGGRERFDAVEVELLDTISDHAATNAEATAQLRVTVKDHDAQLAGRQFSGAVTELALANYPGFFTLAPPGPATPFGVYWPALVAAEQVHPTVTLPSGERVDVPHPHRGGRPTIAEPPAPPPFEAQGATTPLPLGALCGARSGDKGGNANVGLWTWDNDVFAWLVATLSSHRLRQLVPEAAGLDVRRTVLANLRACNFVIVGLLGEGVASSTRYDPQAKGLGEFVRSRIVDVPNELLDHRRRPF